MNYHLLGVTEFDAYKIVTTTQGIIEVIFRFNHCFIYYFFKLLYTKSNDKKYPKEVINNMSDINILKVGQNIAQARKALNMTQMELADKLCISYQAVSNWERGLSMPDIAKLPQLCETLNLRVDDLIRNTHISEQISKIAQGDPGKSNLSAEELIEIAPIMKPDQIEKIHIPTLTIDQIIELCPFLKREYIDALINNIKHESIIIPEQLYRLAPFMSRDPFDRLVNNFLQSGGNISNYQWLAPFVHQDTLEKLITCGKGDGCEDIRLDIGKGKNHVYKIFCGKKIFSDTQLNSDHTIISYRKVFLTVKGNWVYYERQAENYDLWNENIESSYMPGMQSEMLKCIFQTLSSLKQLIPYIGEDNVEKIQRRIDLNKNNIEKLDI